MITTRIHVWISGRVQGVGYRAHTESMALSLGINGWVRNLRTGQVEAVFEGSEAVVDRMVQWCYRGSPAAQVDQVDVQEEDPLGEMSFRILATQ